MKRYAALIVALSAACAAETTSLTLTLQSDLRTPEVAPGDDVETEVRLPRGARIVGSVSASGLANGRFTLSGVQHEDQPDGTRVVVRAHNFSTTKTQFTATFRYQLP
jgi:hypothetical protein